MRSATFNPGLRIIILISLTYVLGKTFKPWQIHWHWGAIDSVGSEHTMKYDPGHLHPGEVRLLMNFIMNEIGALAGNCQKKFAKNVGLNSKSKENEKLYNS